MVPTHGSMMHHDAMAIDPDFLTLKISAMVFPMQSQFPFGSSTSNLHRCWTRPGVDGTGKSDEQKKKSSDHNRTFRSFLEFYMEYQMEYVYHMDILNFQWTFLFLSIDGTAMAHQDAPSQGIPRDPQGIPRAQGLITHCHAHSGAQIIE
jgi:hypothetical protein